MRSAHELRGARYCVKPATVCSTTAGDHHHSTSRRRIGPVALTTFTILGALLLTGCQAGHQAACPGPSIAGPTTADDADKPVVGVLAQTEAIGRDAATDAARHQAVDRIVVAATGEQARLLADSIGGTTTTSVTAADVSFAASGPNKLARDVSQRCAGRAASTALTQLVDTKTHDGINVLAGLASMANHLNGMPRTRTNVVLVGNLAGRTGPLAAADPEQLADPTVTINRLAAANLLPDCRGWRVYAVGGGIGAGLNDEQIIALRELYRLLFERCGGRLVSWDSTLVQFPNPQATVAALPAVEAQPVPRVVPDGLVLTLPGSTFQTASAQLRTDSTPLLQAVLRASLQHKEARVIVSGYTDSTPDLRPGGNTALATSRAAVVADWLVDHGVDRARVTSHGVGAADFVADNATSAGRQANRRVDVFLHG